MDDKEYTEMIVKDTKKQLLMALGIYAVVLTAYWTMVG